MSILAKTIKNDLAGKSCTIDILPQSRPYMRMMVLCATPSILVDLPHFFVSQTDTPDFAIAYFGKRDYEGLASIDSHQVMSLTELQAELDDMKDRPAPQVILADLEHLGLDCPLALGLIADYLEDGTLWDSQVLISVRCVERITLNALLDSESRSVAQTSTFRQGYTAEVHSNNHTEY